jgi:hypothetical protein
MLQLTMKKLMMKVEESEKEDYEEKRRRGSSVAVKWCLIEVFNNSLQEWMGCYC